MTFWEFWHEHYFLAFIAIIGTVSVINTSLKCFVVLFRGWKTGDEFKT